MGAANEHQEYLLPSIRRNNALPLHQRTVGNRGKDLEELFLLGELVLQKLPLIRRREVATWRSTAATSTRADSNTLAWENFSLIKWVQCR